MNIKKLKIIIRDAYILWRLERQTKVGKIIVQSGPPFTGKSERGFKWVQKDIANRIMIDGGTLDEARRLANGVPIKYSSEIKRYAVLLITNEAK